MKRYILLLSILSYILSILPHRYNKLQTCYLYKCKLKEVQKMNTYYTTVKSIYLIFKETLNL